MEFVIVIGTFIVVAWAFYRMGYRDGLNDGFKFRSCK